MLVSVKSSILAARRLSPCQVQHYCVGLVSLRYILLYFLRASLLWQDLKAKNQRPKEELILVNKESTTTKDLCQGLPQEVTAYFVHVRSRGLDDKPRYSYLRKIPRDLFIRQAFEYDFVFD